MHSTERAKRIHVMFLVVSASMGGAESHALSLAKGLDRTRFDVSLVYLKDEAAFPEAHTMVQDGVFVLCLGAERKLDLYAAQQLAAFATNREVDILICANPYPLLYAWVVRLLSPRSPRIVEILHSTEPFTTHTRLQMLAMRPLFWMSDLLVYVCRNQRSYWERKRLAARRVEVVHNGVDLLLFRNGFTTAEISRFRQDHGLADGDYVVGVCGILRREKGHQDLVRAIEAARTAGTAVKCLIIGDGPMRSQIESTVSELGLGEHVRITGLLSDVRLAIACCDVIVVPSHNETFSIAALESMALGKPLIMSEVGGAAELVEHGKNGLLYPREDVERLSDHIQRLADRGRREAFGGASLDRVKRQYSLRHMVESYERLLSLLCPTKANARD